MRRGAVGGQFQAKWFNSSRTDAAGIAIGLLALLFVYSLYRVWRG